jgi:hypothetical protein
MVSQKASLGVRSHDFGACGFKNLPDKSPEKAPTFEGVRVIDNEVAVPGKINRDRLNFLRIRQNRFMSQGP